MKKLRVGEFFSGIGSQRTGLKRARIPHEVVCISEIDKHALKSYEAIHGETKNYGDISKIDPKDLPDMDLMTYSFPCQDVSIIGSEKGLSEESGTKSSLLWECKKIIEEKKPKYLLMENVKNLVGKKHKHNFDKFLKVLSDLGYTNYWKIINAKDHGIPQNRERVFVVSILGYHDKFEFPKDRKNYRFSLQDVVRENYVEVPRNILESYSKKCEAFSKRFKTNAGDYAFCLNTKHQWDVITNNYFCKGFAMENIYDVIKHDIRVCTLNAKGYWKLMGMSEEDYIRASTVCSQRQLSKQAGNSIVVDVLRDIFHQMFKHL